MTQNIHNINAFLLVFISRWLRVCPLFTTLWNEMFEQCLSMFSLIISSIIFMKYCVSGTKHLRQITLQNSLFMIRN